MRWYAGNRRCDEEEDDDDGEEAAAPPPRPPPAPQRWWGEESSEEWWRPEIPHLEFSTASPVSPSARHTDTKQEVVVTSLSELVDKY